MDITEWIKQGQPKTWSPMIDDCLNKSCEHFFTSQNNGEDQDGETALSLFFAYYYNKIQEWKKKKQIKQCEVFEVE